MYCSIARRVWKEVESLILRFAGKRVNLNERRIIFGIMKEDEIYSETKICQNLINKIILIGKHTISKFKFLKSGNPIILLENELWIRNLHF